MRCESVHLGAVKKKVNHCLHGNGAMINSQLWKEEKNVEETRSGRGQGRNKKKQGLFDIPSQRSVIVDILVYIFT